MLSARRFRLALLAALALVGLLLGWIATNFGGLQATLWAVDGANLLAPLLAAIVCLTRGLREQGRSAVGWQALGFGCLAWALGESYIAYHELWVERGLPIPERTIPFPSIADAGFLAFIPLAIVGVLLIPKGIFRSTLRIDAALDAAVIGLAVLSIVWWLGLDAITLASDLSLFESVLLLAYPWGDVLLVSAALAIWTYIGAEERASVAFVVVGVLLFAIADIGYAVLIPAHYPGIHWVTALWPAGFLATALGAARPPLDPGRLASGSLPNRFLLPLFCGTAGAILVMRAVQDNLDSVHAAMGLLLATGLVVRAVRRSAERRRVRRLRDANET